ncbi:spore germination protein GerW family protein (plasmid) [Halorussus salilacus]|uniref:GerW family sporulation protein n=1 Tax=Halorussus salilacus TaxID=2953750 RepID=UPI00209DB990|nr:spore germination protein GerW family protein [Halorussus salilacus]USZ69982.1 spore germination protein GerW family protein [Halorussus salilacus]
MSAARIESLVERLARSANARTVFGDPIERGDRTVIPVARVSYGFGGGYGRVGGGDRKRERAGRDEANRGPVGVRGGGGGGSASATPVGALEIRDGATEFVRFERERPGFPGALALALAGFGIGLAVGRRWGRD